jgi:hypothetical protein
MKQMKIPDKVIKPTQMTMNITQAKVKINNKLSAESEFNAGLKQYYS